MADELVVEEPGRADAILRHQYPAASRAMIRDAFASGAVSVAGKPIRKSTALEAHDRVIVTCPLPRDRRDLLPRPESRCDLIVVAESKDFVAVAKPGGMHAHPLLMNESGTAANHLARYAPECADTSDDPREGGLIHRLDAGTSGVLAFARNRDSWRRARTHLENGHARKTYLAVVSGKPGDGGSDAPLANRGPTVVVDPRSGRQTSSTWSLLDRHDDFGLVRVETSTGFRHQVRVHLATAGLPIVGDSQYGGVASPPRLVGFLLHAETLGLADEFSARAPLPEARAILVRQLGLSVESDA